MMKIRFKSLFCAIVITCFSLSCRKKSDPSPANPLIGSWKEVSYVFSGCTDPADDLGLTNCTTDCETLIFTATTLKISQGGSADETNNYSVNGNVLTVSPNVTGVSITFAVSGTTLTLTAKNTPAYGACTVVETLTKI